MKLTKAMFIMSLCFTLLVAWCVGNNKSVSSHDDKKIPTIPV